MTARAAAHALMKQLAAGHARSWQQTAAAAQPWLHAGGAGWPHRCLATTTSPVLQQQQQQQPPPSTPGPAAAAAAYARSFLAPPASLACARGEVVYPPQLEGNPLGRLLLRLIGAYGRGQRLRNGAALLYNAVTEAAEDAALQRAVGLEPGRFMTPHTLLSLHMWLVINRLQPHALAAAAELQQQQQQQQHLAGSPSSSSSSSSSSTSFSQRSGAEASSSSSAAAATVISDGDVDAAAAGPTQLAKDAKRFAQVLYTEFFFKDVERRVYAHGVTVHVSKWMKRLEQQFYGSCVAYDVALRGGGGGGGGGAEGGGGIEGAGGAAAAAAAAAAAGGGGGGEAALAQVLLKNVYDGDDAQRPWAALLARYLLREQECLALTPTAAVLRGHVRFSAGGAAVVAGPGAAAAGGGGGM